MMNDSTEFHTETGQTMAEYAVVLGVITFVIVTTLSVLSDTVVSAFNRTVSILTSVV